MLIAISEPFVNNIISFQTESLEIHVTSQTGGDGGKAVGFKRKMQALPDLYWGSWDLSSKAKASVWFFVFCLFFCLFSKFLFVARLACDSLCSPP